MKNVNMHICQKVMWNFGKGSLMQISEEMQWCTKNYGLEGLSVWWYGNVLLNRWKKIRKYVICT